MRKRAFMYISSLAIIAVVVLQGLGLLHSYRFVEEKLFAKVNRCFMEAMRKEGALRCNEASKVICRQMLESSMHAVQSCIYTQIRPTKIGEYNTNEFLLMLSSQGTASYMDSIGIYKSQLQPEILDSLFRDELYNIGYADPEFRIDTAVPISSDRYRYFNDLVNDSTLVRNRKEMATTICPAKAHSTNGYQAILFNPQGKIFNELQLFIFGTLLLSFTVLFCIWRQILTVKRQSKLSKLHENFSHFIINNEMKTPMNTIVSEADALQNGFADDIRQKEEESLTLIEQASETLLTLTNRILTLYKADNGKLELHKQEIPLEPIIKNLENKIIAKVNFPVRFVTELTVETVFADEELLKESLSAVIESTLKNCSESVEINISVSKTDNGSVQIQIKDNRPYPPEDFKLNDDKSMEFRMNYLTHIVKAQGGSVEIKQAKRGHGCTTIITV